MGVLQLDSVNVVCRSHYLPMLARLGPYDRSALDRWLWRSGENTEFLAHEASITSLDLHRLVRFRMNEGRWNLGRRFEAEHPDYVAAVLAQVADEGPLTVSDLEDPGERSGPWWGYSKGKLVLEWLYVTGRLAIADRTAGFTTCYDLAERVLGEPPAPIMDDAAAKRELARRGVGHLGIGTAADVADYFRLSRPETRSLLMELVDTADVVETAVEGWSAPAYHLPGVAVPRRVPGRALLSPFDPLVWHRSRAEALFDFAYRIEIYVPADKRRYGYYVLPFLLNEQLVARVDVKADRRDGRLLVRGVFLEADDRAAGPADADGVIPELAAALVEFAGFLDLDGTTVSPGPDPAADLAGAVADAEAAGR